jgi:hypothetical protein
MTLQKPAKTTDPVDALILAALRRRIKQSENPAGRYIADIDEDVSRATGLPLERIEAIDPYVNGWSAYD